MAEALWGSTSAAVIQQQLFTRYVARNLVCLDSTTSTQDHAREAAEAGAPEGTVVLTEEQTQGRGRFQRSWVSARGGSVLFSLVLRPPNEVAPRLPILTALAAVRAVKGTTGMSAEIKWPNDIQIGGKKIAGILIDAMVKDERVGYAIVGMGMNVGLDPAVHPDIAATATSLELQTGWPVDRVAVFIALMGQIEALYDASRAGVSMIEEYRSNLSTLGKHIEVIWPGVGNGEASSIEGIAEDVDAVGALLLRRDDGSLVQITGGEVTLRASSKE